MRVRFLFQILLTAGMALIFGVGAAHANAKLLPKAVCVDGGTLRMSDLSGRSDQQAIVLADLAADKSWFSGDELRASYEQNRAGDREEYIWPKRIIVQKGGRVFEQAQIKSQVDKKLTSILAGLPGEISCREYRLPERIFLPAKSSRLVFNFPKNIEPGRVVFKMVVQEADGRIIKKYSGNVFVDQWVSVPCAASPLNRNNYLDPAGVRFERKNSAYLRSEPWDGRGGPWRMTRAVGIGQIIYKGSLEPLPAVCKGQGVELVFEGKHIFLSVPAMALQDGHIGSTIVVRNLQSKKTVSAQIRDNRTVVVR